MKKEILPESITNIADFEEVDIRYEYEEKDFATLKEAKKDAEKHKVSIRPLGKNPAKNPLQ